MIPVELLYFEGCPNFVRAEDEVREALKNSNYAADIRSIEISEDNADDSRFLGSPTVRIDGVDVDPSARSRTGYGLQCRVYRYEGGVYGWPPAKMIAEAIAERTID